MNLKGNVVTVTQSNAQLVKPVASVGSIPVKSNFENLTSIKTPAMNTGIVSSGSSVAIKSPTPAPIVNIKPIAVNTASAGTITATMPTKAVAQPSPGVINIKPVGVVTNPGTQTITANIPDIKAGIQPSSGVINIKPVGLVETKPATNPITSPLPMIKPAGTQTIISVKTVVFDGTATLPYVNVWIDGKAVAGSDIDGKVLLPNVNCESQITFSYVGYQSQTFIAKNVPAKIILQTDDMLDEVVIKNNYKAPTADDEKKPSWFWWILLVAGVAIYGGYKYTQDKKTKKIVKTKI